MSMPAAVSLANGLPAAHSQTLPTLNGHSNGNGNGHSNGSATPREDWVVCKFGGTSVGKFPVNVADIVSQTSKNRHVAVVCSARSSTTKSEGSTNRLLRAAREAENRRSVACREVIAAIRDDHIAAAKSYIRDGANLTAFIAEVQTECQDLESFLQATQTIGEISDRSLDTIISKGEVLACRFMAAVLRDRGVEAQYVDLTNIVDFDAEQGVDQDFYDKLAVRLGAAARNVGAVVPVMTGYFGTVPGGLLKNIGRGYTDLCAALVAVGLRASELQVIKEVDGVFTADPRKVITARLLDTISPAEAAELTFYGSEVIHPYTMEQVIRACIPIRIKNVMNARGQGTTIVPDPLVATSYPHRPGSPGSPDPTSPRSPRKSLFRSRSSTTTSLLSLNAPKRPTAITIKHNILVLNVHSNKRSLSHGFFARIFGILDKHKLSVDLISTSEVHVSMALHSESALVSGDEESKRIVATNLEEAVRELQKIGSVDLIDGMAILSLVGMQMKNMVGIAGKMFSVLGESGVNIEMISQGASEINISCVIDERDADRALNILHTHLFTFMD